LDAKTGKPVSLPEDVIDRFRHESPRVFPFERFPKVTPVETPLRTQRQVESMDLDAYEHVNNAIYIDYAEEAAAQDFSSRGWSPTKLVEADLAIVISRLHILYSAQPAWGETLTISTHALDVKDTGGSRYVGMTYADGSSVAECIMDWALVDRKSGEARPLPDGLR
jgi:acyl-CoA thioester hydrolase